MIFCYGCNKKVFLDLLEVQYVSSRSKKLTFETGGPEFSSNDECTFYGFFSNCKLE